MVGPERRILVIGAGGFVGRRLMPVLEARFGIGAAIPSARAPDREAVALDLDEDRSVRAALGRVAPTHVVNLAGIADRGTARRDPERAWALHVFAAERLGRAMGDLCPEAWLLQVGAGRAYGRAPDGRGLAETDPLEPAETWALTKAAGDLAVGALARQGLPALRLRPFDHAGPGQPACFALPALARRVARIEAGLEAPELRLGGRDAARDLVHVDDVAAAYAAVVAATGAIATGTALNVASGEAVTLRGLAERMLALSEAEIALHVEPEGPAIVGDAARLRAATGWAPRRGPQEMVAEALARARAAVARGRV